MKITGTISRRTSPPLSPSLPGLQMKLAKRAWAVCSHNPSRTRMWRHGTLRTINAMSLIQKQNQNRTKAIADIAKYCAWLPESPEVLGTGRAYTANLASTVIGPVYAVLRASRGAAGPGRFRHVLSLCLREPRSEPLIPSPGLIAAVANVGISASGL